MTTQPDVPAAATAPAHTHDGSYIDIPAILAGGVIATGVASVFTTFGAGIGFSSITPYEGDGAAWASVLAVGSWMLWTTISSTMVGAYVSGRMRRRVEAASPDEVAIRDGIHGLAVWGLGIILAAFLIGGAAATSVTALSDAPAEITQQATGDAGADGSPEAGAADEASELTAAEQAEMAEMAQKYSVISAFVASAGLLIAGAAAYWAAGMGGHHRDEGRVFARFGVWR